MGRPTPSVWNVGAGTALLGLLFTGMWAELDRLGAPVWGVVFAALGLAYACLRRAGSPAFELPRAELTRTDRLLSTALLAPLALTAVLTWNDDFPLSGDHDHHFLAIAAAARFWSKNWLALVGFAGVTLALVARARRAWWPFAVFAVMIAVSFKPEVPAEYFARYPATFYTLAAPFHILGEWFGIRSPWKFDHVVNLLAPVIWLLVLRPRLFGSTARRGWLVTAVFLLTQREVIYFTDSLTLDVWSLVFAALAFEALFHADDRPWLAPLLAGVACTFRDASVFVFLTVGAAAAWRARPSLDRLAMVISGGTLGILPFLVYYVERRSVGIWRTVDLAPLADVFTPERIANLQARWTDQFGTLGLAALALTLLVTFGYAVIGGRTTFGTVALVVLGALGQFYVTFADTFLSAWPGLPHLTFLPFVTLVSITQILPSRWAWGLAIALGSAQAPVLGRYIAALSSPAYTRNFSEDYAVPIYVPLRAAVARVALTPGQTVRWIRDNEFEHPNALPMVYPELWAKYRWETVSWEAREDQCRCAPGVALIVSTPRTRHLRSSLPHAPYPAPIDRVNDACRAAAARTCRCVEIGEPAEARVCVTP